jgi:hypothetical protein
MNARTSILPDIIVPDQELFDILDITDDLEIAENMFSYLQNNNNHNYLCSTQQPEVSIPFTSDVTKVAMPIIDNRLTRQQFQCIN